MAPPRQSCTTILPAADGTTRTTLLSLGVGNRFFPATQNKDATRFAAGPAHEVCRNKQDALFRGRSLRRTLIQSAKSVAPMRHESRETARARRPPHVSVARVLSAPLQKMRCLQRRALSPRAVVLDATHKIARSLRLVRRGRKLGHNLVCHYISLATTIWCG